MVNTQTQTKTYSEEKIWYILKEVTDPEIPVLNVVEMGIVRDVIVDDESVTVKITPTYSGCPAMVAIEQLINLKLAEKGIEHFEVEVAYEEAWTTEWMTEEAKQKLKDYGIAPPRHLDKSEDDIFGPETKKVIKCPYCDSENTKKQAEFGSTACKAQYFCENCHQPFEYFKCH